MMMAPSSADNTDTMINVSGQPSSVAFSAKKNGMGERVTVSNGSYAALSFHFCTGKSLLGITTLILKM